MYKNAGRAILKSCALWKFVIVMTAASNCVYGSMLSPGRLFQIREAVDSYMEHTDPLQCEFFLYYLPWLIEQLGLDVKTTDEDAYMVGLCISWWLFARDV